MMTFLSDRPSLRLEALNALPFSSPRHMLTAHNNIEAMPRGIKKTVLLSTSHILRQKERKCNIQARHQYRHDQAFGDDFTIGRRPGLFLCRLGIVLQNRRHN